MKRIACLLAIAAFAVVVPSYGQSAEDTVSGFGIRKPTPKPSGSAAPSAAATGPMEAGLYKDAQAKSATTTFAPTDTIYVIGKNVPSKKGDKLGVNWYGKGDKKLTTSETTVSNDGSYGPSFHLSPPAKGGTPAGSYRADFVQNGKVLKRLPFTVK